VQSLEGLFSAALYERLWVRLARGSGASKLRKDKQQEQYHQYEEKLTFFQSE
jgi:hypothetical protein